MEDDDRIKSKPEYGPINSLKKADFYLFIGEKEEVSALENLFDECKSDNKELLFFTLNGLLNRTELTEYFSTLPVSSEVYIAGTEAFMWDVQTIAISAGLFSEQINLLPPTSSVRRVFCTHCYTLMENVAYTPIVCEGCGLSLLVRDHFSRHHSAYVGLNINAEDAADIPEIRRFT